LTSWQYLWRTTPMRRKEEAGEAASNTAPPLPGGVASEELQTHDGGSGPLLHRVYRVTIANATSSAAEVMQRMQANPDCVSPSEFAQFIKVAGAEMEMCAGDEFVVRMPGPWDGPVRVIDVTPTSFRFATLKGHLEAGQIEFRAHDGQPLQFEIESWARSGDRFSAFLFDRLPMAKEVQLHMWICVLERVVKLAAGERSGPLEVYTRRVEMADRDA